MKKVTRRFQSEFINNSLKLLSSNAIAQTVGLLIYPLLTRIYAPEDFGLVNLFLSIGGVIALFATAEYQYAIMLPKSEKKAVACFQVGFLICLGVTLFCVLTVPFATPIAQLFNTPELANWYFLLPVFVFLTAVWVLLNYWYTRHKNFSNIGTYQLSQSVIGAGAKYGFGFAGFTSGGLLVATVCAPLVSIVASTFGVFKRLVKPLFVFDKTACRTEAKTYANFPKFALPRAVVNNFSNALPVLLLTPFFGLAEIGFWGMALTLAFRPINMISGSLYQVFFQRTSEQVHNGKSIMPFLKKYVCNTALLVVPLFTILFFVLPSLCEWLLGASWGVTGKYIQTMLPWLACSIIIAPIGYIADIFNQQKWSLFFEILMVIMRLTGLFLGLWMNDFYITILGYCIGSAIGMFVQIFWYSNIVIRYERSL